jgi:hypothetical protein
MSPRFHITKSLERCIASSIGISYESGPLLSNDETYFDIDTIEVWAVRCPDHTTYTKSVTDGLRQLAIKEEVRSKCSRVDKAQFLDDFRSGAYMNHLFDHQRATRGRADCVAADNQKKGYYLNEKSPSKKFISTDEESSL